MWQFDSAVDIIGWPLFVPGNTRPYDLDTTTRAPVSLKKIYLRLGRSVSAKEDLYFARDYPANVANC